MYMGPAFSAEPLRALGFPHATSTCCIDPALDCQRVFFFFFFHRHIGQSSQRTPQVDKTCSLVTLAAGTPLLKNME